MQKKNNYVERQRDNNAAKSFDSPATNLNIYAT